MDNTNEKKEKANIIEILNIDGEYKFYFNFILSAGLRRKEILDLKINDID